MDIRPPAFGVVMLLLVGVVLGCAGATPQARQPLSDGVRPDVAEAMAPHARSGTAAPPPGRPPSSPAVTEISGRAVAAAPPGAASPGPAETTTRVLSRSALEDAFQDVGGVGDLGDLRPNFTLRGMDGIAVQGLPTRSPLRGLGLQAGDVVHSINGHRFTSIGAAMQAVGALQEAERFVGEITRNGRRETLVIVLE